MEMHTHVHTATHSYTQLKIMCFALKFQCLHLLGMEQMKLVVQVPREEEWEERVTTGLPEAWPVPMAAAWETWWRDSEAVTETLLSGSASDLGTMKSFNRTGWGACS